MDTFTQFMEQMSHGFLSKLTNPEWLGEQGAENLMQAIIFAGLIALVWLILTRANEWRQARAGGYSSKMVLTVCIFLRQPQGRWLLQLRTIGEVWIGEQVSYPADERMIKRETARSIKTGEPILDLSPPAQERIIPTLINLGSTSDDEAISIFISRAATGERVGNTHYFSTSIVCESGSTNGKLCQLFVSVGMMEGPLRHDKDIWDKVDLEDPRHAIRIQTIRKMVAKNDHKALPTVELSNKYA